MLNRRIRGVVLGTAATLAIADMAACSGPTVYPVLNSSGGVYDNYHHEIVRLNDAQTIGVDNVARVVRNDGRSWADGVGWAGIFSGVTVEAIPTGTPTGPLGYEQITTLFGGWKLTNRYYEAPFHMQASFTLYGYGFHISKGDCTLITYFHTHPSSAYGQEPHVTCSQLAVASTRMTTADAGVYDRLPPAAQTRVRQFQAWAATLHFGSN